MASLRDRHDLERINLNPLQSALFGISAERQSRNYSPTPRINLDNTGITSFIPPLRERGIGWGSEDEASAEIKSAFDELMALGLIEPKLLSYASVSHDGWLFLNLKRGTTGPEQAPGQ
jgi:hypothetical protein